ncbi:unnamed protein product [Heligmosomoides polygyrus]|uniref:Secreted protein n=1 Tax=Heligmosomoides polygyrus TaxID=6339 RepID=A0A183FU29_HELPZ|nr:unnamed protein product [Heligmosomoides polygyrus]
MFAMMRLCESVLKDPLTISVTCSIYKTIVAAITIFRSPNMTVEVTYDFFSQYLCCLLIKLGSKLIIGSLSLSAGNK